MSQKKSAYSELLDQLNGYGERELDKESEQLVESLTQQLSEVMKEYGEQEYDLGKMLQDDDYLLEELVDRVAYLNFVEANAGEDHKKGGVSDEDMEKAYLAVIDSLFELSKTITPVAGFGRDRLESGLSIIKIFEERFWPLSTVITAQNMAAFEDYLTSEYRDDIAAGKKQAIGALRHVGEDMCAAGAIVYTVNRANEDFPLSLSLDYIFVDKSIRSRGIGNFLMAELLELVLQNEGTNLFAEMPIIEDMDDEDRDEHAVLENFLDSWGFVFSVAESLDFVIKIRGAKGNKAVERKPKKAVSLYSLGDKGASLLKAFFKKCNNDMDADISALPYEFFDQDVSCAVTDEKGIRSVLLVHRLENGNYRYEALRYDPDHQDEDVHELLAYAYRVCVSVGDEENMVFGTFDSEEAVELARELCPDGRILIKYRGVLMPPEPGEAITTEGWDELRAEAGLSDYKIPDKGIDDDGIGSKELGMIKDYIRKYSE